jgi:hypothetical protein
MYYLLRHVISQLSGANCPEKDIVIFDEMDFSFVKNYDEPLYVNHFTPFSIANSDYTFSI